MKGLSTKKKVLLGIVLGLLLVVAGVYLGVSIFFRTHFFSGSTINGIDCGRMTVAQVKEAIQDRVSEYSLTLKERGDVTEQITADQFGLTYVDDNGVEKLLAEQNPFLWMFSIGKNKSYEMTANTTYKQENIDGILDGLSCFNSANVTAPADAYIAETDSGYAIMPEVQGNTLKRAEVKAAVENAVETGSMELDLEEAGLYEKPSVLSTDERLNTQVQQLNLLTSANIVYDFVDRQYTVDRSVIKEWLTLDENGNYKIDEAQAAAWVKQMAYETDTFGLAHTFKTTLGPTITLARGGDYGWVINKSKTTEELVAAVNSGTQGELEPVYLYEGKDRSSNDIGGTYVEICIKEQMMWCYKDGKLAVETPVITGNHSTGYDTPSGSVWAIDAKQRDRHFDTYNADVTFWLPFNGDVGIHDASWRQPEDYTKTLYETNGSHGCINTPFDKAEQIFNIVDIGYPVIVYYSTDQVVGPAPTQENEMG